MTKYIVWLSETRTFETVVDVERTSDAVPVAKVQWANARTNGAPDIVTQEDFRMRRVESLESTPEEARVLRRAREWRNLHGDTPPLADAVVDAERRLAEAIDDLELGFTDE